MKKIIIVTCGRQNDTPFLHNRPNENTEVQKLRFYLQPNPLNGKSCISYFYFLEDCFVVQHKHHEIMAKS